MNDRPHTGDLAAAFLAEAQRRMFEESRPRILACLGRLDERRVWWRPNERSNAIGNLVLHLCGNVRQWIIAGLGGEPDERRRQAEFDERGPTPVEELVERFEATMAKARRTLDALDPATLLEKRTVQGFEESGLSIIVHVVEHLSYHTGQISYITKMLLDGDLGFYAGRDLDVTG